jgi:hypothetical protein
MYRAKKKNSRFFWYHGSSSRYYRPCCCGVGRSISSPIIASRSNTTKQVTTVTLLMFTRGLKVKTKHKRCLCQTHTTYILENMASEDKLTLPTPLSISNTQNLLFESRRYSHDCITHFFFFFFSTDYREN